MDNNTMRKVKKDDGIDLEKGKKLAYKQDVSKLANNKSNKDISNKDSSDKNVDNNKNGKKDNKISHNSKSNIIRAKSVKEHGSVDNDSHLDTKISSYSNENVKNKNKLESYKDSTANNNKRLSASDKFEAEHSNNSKDKMKDMQKTK